MKLPMRLMTYNILNGGLDGADPSRWPLLMDTIRSAAPDVLVLDECNDFDRNGQRRLHDVERELGMRGFLALSTTGYHVALFVKPSVEVLEHGAVPTANHSLLHAALRHRGQEFRIVAVHLCPFGGQTRLLEAEYVTRWLRGDQWAFVAGDLNAISPHDAARVNLDGWEPHRQARHAVAGSRVVDTRALAFLESSGLVDLAHRAGKNTLPTITPLLGNDPSHHLRIDYILGTRVVAENLRQVEVINNEVTRRASDHFPVCVDVNIGS